MDARIIAPRGKERVTRRGTPWFGWTLALLAIAGFARLGFWQYGRMLEKEARLAEVARVLQEKQAFSLASDIVPMPGTMKWVEDTGRIEPDTLLLDNQMRGGRQGVHVYCVFDVGRRWGGGHRLIDFGWTPMSADRKVPDHIACPAGDLKVRGLLLDAPSTGVAVGDAMQSIGPRRWLMTRIDDAAIQKATGYVVWPSVVRLDPEMKIGYARDLDVLPNTLPPERHLGYAVQWWALSLAVLVTALVLTFRKKKPRA